MQNTLIAMEYCSISH